MKLILSITILVLMPLVSQAQEAGVKYQWKQALNKGGITIFTSKIKGSAFKAVRAKMVVTGRLSSLVALVTDVDACAAWADLCKKSSVYKFISDREKLIYIQHDIPFPVADRDVLAHVLWQQNPETGTVMMTSVATKNILPKKKKVVRIENALSQWHFTPLKDNKVLVESYAHVDPNGATPAWITNLLLVNSPFKTMKKMREIIEIGKYADAEISFVKEAIVNATQ